MIKVGEIAPDFTARLSDNSSLTLSAFRGASRVVLVFYPGDNTPTCTSQLCALRDTWPDFQTLHTRVYGVNPAGEERHSRFAARNRFPFPLIVDTGGKVAAAYGCRMMFGLIKRTVFMVDRQGRIAYARRGNPSPDELLKVLARVDDGPAPAY